MNATPEIPGFLDRRPLIWSYSLLDAFYNKCPLSAQAMYIDRSIPYVETPERKFGNDGHDALDKRVGGGKPLPEQYQFCEPFAVPFDGRQAVTESWYYIDTEGRACERNSPKKFGHGKIDLALIQGDIAFINDWKFVSDKALRYEDPFEIKIFGLLLKAKYPQLKTIKGHYTYLKQNKTSQVYDVSDTAATWNLVCSIMQTIYNYQRLNEFPKKVTPLCGWCGRFECADNTNPNRPE